MPHQWVLALVLVPILCSAEVASARDGAKRGGTPLGQVVVAATKAEARRWGDGLLLTKEGRARRDARLRERAEALAKARRTVKDYDWSKTIGQRAAMRKSGEIERAREIIDRHQFVRYARWGLVTWPLALAVVGEAVAPGTLNAVTQHAGELPGWLASQSPAIAGGLAVGFAGGVTGRVVSQLRRPSPAPAR